MKRRGRPKTFAPGVIVVRLPVDVLAALDAASAPHEARSSAARRLISAGLGVRERERPEHLALIEILRLSLARAQAEAADWRLRATIAERDTRSGGAS